VSAPRARPSDRLEGIESSMWQQVPPHRCHTYPQLRGVGWGGGCLVPGDFPGAGATSYACLHVPLLLRCWRDACVPDSGLRSPYSEYGIGSWVKGCGKARSECGIWAPHEVLPTCIYIQTSAAAAAATARGNFPAHLPLCWLTFPWKINKRLAPTVAKKSATGHGFCCCSPTHLAAPQGGSSVLQGALWKTGAVWLC